MASKYIDIVPSVEDASTPLPFSIVEFIRNLFEDYKIQRTLNFLTFTLIFDP